MKRKLFFLGIYRDWGFPKIRGTLLGVPIKRTMVFGGLHWGPPIWGDFLFKAELRLWLSGFQVKSALARHASRGLGLIGSS